MKRSCSWVVAIALAIGMLAPPASGQTRDTLIFAYASGSGTYAAMTKEVRDVCKDEITIVEGTSPTIGGATTNLEALMNNKVSAALMHSDVVYARAQADPAVRKLQTLVALYPEDIHVLVLRNSRTKHFLKRIEFTTLSDLAGYKVGAAGGGVITARILTGQGEGHFDVVELASGKEVLPALDAGDIQAAIFVGGAPLPNLEKLTADQYKLIPIGETISSHLTGVYRPTIINYTNLNSGDIKTMAPTAIVLTRKYTIPKLVRPQATFRNCFYSHLDELQQTPGKHPKWQLVLPPSDPNYRGPWEWYEIPTIPARH
ncbi:MAG TPA: TAXI family TRAP transporter solute-binding subunit [Gemmatimonadales bacterium]|jgi:TRAP-type uncharacterized transport system substrate-binding protein|nr:TAXI family TRAP transporter solute-binding subunit [Gemmatimonadales bacterium]